MGLLYVSLIIHVYKLKVIFDQNKFGGVVCVDAYDDASSEYPYYGSRLHYNIIF